MVGEGREKNPVILKDAQMGSLQVRVGRRGDGDSWTMFLYGNCSHSCLCCFYYLGTFVQKTLSLVDWPKSAECYSSLELKGRFPFPPVVLLS